MASIVCIYAFRLTEYITQEDRVDYLLLIEFIKVNLSYDFGTG